MDRNVAIRKLARILGKTFGYQIDPKAPKRDEREAAQAALAGAIAERDAANAKRDARYRALLDNDPEYQVLKANALAARERVSHLSAITHHFKITVGTQSKLFFHVAAQGDTWEDVLVNLKSKSNERAA